MLKHLLLLSIFLCTNLNIHGMEKNIHNELFASASRGRTERVNELLQLGANPNHIHLLFQDTVLQAASRGGHIEIVESLLNAGADCNAHAKNDTGRTALMEAVFSGKLVIVKALLKKGAFVNDKSSSGVAAMRCAALDGYIEIGLELLQHGASLEGTHRTWQLKLQEALQEKGLLDKEFKALFLNQALKDAMMLK